MGIFNNNRFAVVSHILPPSPSGQAMVLYKLLQTVNQDDYCLISTNSHSEHCDEPKGSATLPGSFYYLKPAFHLARPNRFKLRVLRNVFNNIWRIYRRAVQLKTIIRENNINVVVSCSGDLYDMPAACLACMWTSTSFVAYMFDDYMYQWTGPLRQWAVWLEPKFIKQAKAVIVPNEFLKDEYFRRYGVQSTIIRNPCDVQGSGGNSSHPVVSDKAMFNIVYTGSVYHAHYDAFRNLVQAVQSLGRGDILFHIYTAQPKEQLESEGIAGNSVVYHEHIGQEEVNRVLSQADLLFLPLAFNSPIPEVIKTSAPGKMGEYLATGMPILVHAPADSFVSWYFRKNKCGVVIDDNNPVTLAQAIEKILAETELLRDIGENARHQALTDFDITAARSGFLELIKSAGGNK